MAMNGGGSTGFCSYSMTTVNRWNIQTWCAIALTSINMLLNTAISRFIRRMLATKRYIAMASGVIQRPGRQASSTIDSETS